MRFDFILPELAADSESKFHSTQPKHEELILSSRQLLESQGSWASSDRKWELEIQGAVSRSLSLSCGLSCVYLLSLCLTFALSPSPCHFILFHCEPVPQNVHQPQHCVISFLPNILLQPNSVSQSSDSKSPRKKFSLDTVFQSPAVNFQKAYRCDLISDCLGSRAFSLTQDRSSVQDQII